MTKLLPCLLLLAALASPAPVAAQPVPDFPPGTLQLEMKLRAQVGPRTREWLRLEAQRQVATNTVNEYAARESVRTHHGLEALSGREIEAVSYLLLVQAARFARQDMEAIEFGLRRIDTTRALMGGSGSGGATDDAKTTGATQPARSQAPVATPRALGKDEFERRLAAAAGRDEALAELAKSEEQRLSLAAERLDKLMALLARVSHKLGQAQARVASSTP